MADIDTSTFTEDKALSLFHQLRSQFGWSGTIFMRGDVESMVATELGFADDDELTEDEKAVVARYTDQVVDDYSYRKLGDILAERGNETLYDAVKDAVMHRTRPDST